MVLEICNEYDICIIGYGKKNSRKTYFVSIDKKYNSILF